METVKEKAEKVLSCIEKLKEVGEATSFELISRYTNIDDTELQEVARYMETEGLANLVTPKQRVGRLALPGNHNPRH